MNNHPQQPLLTTDEALNFMLERAKVNVDIVAASLDGCLNQVLASDIYANINVPGFDNSAMDGYAIALKPEQINTPTKLNFKITDRIPAGTIGNTLAPGCAAQIFTGAPIPQGANTVVMQERCKLSADGKSIETYHPLSTQENINPMGNDIEKNAVILSAGKQLQPEDIAIAASVGVAQLPLFKKIKVGVFFTGDELLEPDSVLSEGKIFNSNRYALVALLHKLGCEVINLGNVKDDLKTTCQALEILKTDCDLIMTTGGVSVGEEDYVKPAVEKLGNLSLWRIKMKPGKPLAFGNVGKAAFIGLPGNPVSVMVTFFIFAQPFIKKMQGIQQHKNQTIPVQSNFDWPKPKARREFVRVQLDYSTTPASANLYPKQDSNVLSSMVWGDGLLEMPENTAFAKGEIFNYYSLL